VSSQTLPNLSIIDSATDKLVLRPLIASHKQDIIDQANEIGTADFAKHMPEYCGVISVNPTTHAKRHRMEHEEKQFDMAVLERALERAKHLHRPCDRRVGQGHRDRRSGRGAAGQIVIDIRHPMPRKTNRWHWTVSKSRPCRSTRSTASSSTWTPRASTCCIATKA
jgi:thiamine biosynthesis protein ThiI